MELQNGGGCQLPALHLTPPNNEDKTNFWRWNRQSYGQYTQANQIYHQAAFNGTKYTKKKVFVGVLHSWTDSPGHQDIDTFKATSSPFQKLPIMTMFTFSRLPKSKD